MPDLTSGLFWHFLPNDRRMHYPPHTPVEAGATYTVTGRLVVCGNGLHASREALDALRYAPGSIVCRVRLGREIIHEDDKVCARERTVLWIAEAGPVLHELSCLLAIRSLDRLRLSGYPLDLLRPEAIAAKRAWLRGEIDDEALAVAGRATWGYVRSITIRDPCIALRFAVRFLRDTVRELDGRDAWEPARQAISLELEHMLFQLAPTERISA